ncbi:MAG TPA: ABC transporter permease [Gammaproteobacteria bacterium]
MSLTPSDLKYALRLLVKRPVFTLLTVAMLAGGLSITLYTFTVLHVMLYRDLPLPEGGSIVKIGAGSWADIDLLDAFELKELRENASSFSELGVYRASSALVGESGATRSVRSVESDWRIFEFTRTPPLLGRGFVADDNSAASEPVVVLGYETWQKVFSGDAAVVGELARINGRLTRVVGVMPQGYAFPETAELWLPLGLKDLAPAGYTGGGLQTYARLRAGVTVEEAQTELTALVQRVREQRPATSRQISDPVAVLEFQEGGVFATVLFGVLNLLSVSILLLAAVNVGNLLLARTNERIKEIGIRLSLGAPRWRLIAQITLENAILCSVGGLVALFVTARALDLTNDFMRTAFSNLPFWWTWGLDSGVVGAAGVSLLLTVLVVSVLPALCVSTVDPIALLREGTGAGQGRGVGRISRELVTIQIALISGIIVVGGAAAVVADRAANFDYGMDTDGLLSMRLGLPAESYRTEAERLSFYERLLAELRSADGIEAAAIMQEAGLVRFGVDGRDYATPDDRPGAFRILFSGSPLPIGPTLLEGRLFDSRDSATAFRTAIVSESLAREYWPNESPLGRRLDVARGESEAEQRTVVGVVADVRYDQLGQSGVGDSAIYLPVQQGPVFQGTQMLVRQLGEESRARSAMYEALERIDPTIAPDIMTYDDALQRITFFASTMSRLFAACGAFAILLAVTGIYGMSRNSVLLRSHEIGLRRALGASGEAVVATFVAQGVKQLARGLGISALLCAGILVVLQIGFSIGYWAMALLAGGVVLVVSACVLLSIYLAVRGVVRLEPSAALRIG